MFQMFHSCINIPENENTMISIIGLMECIVFTFCIGTNVFYVDRLYLFIIVHIRMCRIICGTYLLALLLCIIRKLIGLFTKAAVIALPTFFAAFVGV